MNDGPQIDADHEAADHQHDSDGDDHRHEHDDHHDHDDHHEHDVETVGVAVVTISSTRSLDDDPAGDAVVAAFDEAGHEVVTRQLVDDDFDGIQATVDNLVDREDVDAVVTAGGTGVTPDDVTVEAVDDILRKRLPGFGELFRRLSYEEIGTRVVGTCAAAGVSRGVIIFCLPGSENAARLGTEEIIVPEVPHLVGLASRDGEE
ncbi:MogA/MoaB family molybdenum cofactor biosynthesis protein [Halopelagius fulvigenes]|uniref:Molybdenum cofactor biosynthesis protein B n=1 Tax=Halopelagius fulvigenes TaxID=1198324 RepID=A0ABD5U0A2_9EURY